MTFILQHFQVIHIHTIYKMYKIIDDIEYLNLTCISLVKSKKNQASICLIGVPSLVGFVALIYLVQAFKV